MRSPLSVNVLDFTLPRMCAGWEPKGAGSVEPLRRNGQQGTAERGKSMLKTACVKGNRRRVPPECHVRRGFRGTRFIACAGGPNRPPSPVPAQGFYSPNILGFVRYSKG